MHAYRYVRQKTHGMHNFDAYQIFVAEMRDTKQKLHSGVLVLHAGSMGGEIPYPLSDIQAQDFVKFLRAACEHKLPVSHVLKGGFFNYFNNLRVSLKQEDSDARGVTVNGGIALGNCLGYQTNRVKIPKQSLLNCAEKIETLYGITKTA